MRGAQIALVCVALGAGCYTTPRTSWPDADFSTAGHGGTGGSGGTGGGPVGTAGNGGASGVDGSGGCGDGVTNGSEICDGGRSGSTELGACNPECTGYYEKKFGRLTVNYYLTDLGGIDGADAKCQMEFGSGWKALLVGGARRATRTPFVGDGQDWVIKKYTHYYNLQNELVWQTDSIPLLGVRNGARVSLNATFFDDVGAYPWAGWAADWTTIPDAGSAGTCNGWTSNTVGWASFVRADLSTSASETCGSGGYILCVQQ